MSGLRTIEFLAIVLTALAIVPSGAHLLALPNKIGLAQEQYFTVQGIYRGWAFLGLLWIAALVANLTLAVMVRSQPGPFWLAALAFLLLLASLVVFFVWTQPANAATNNWTGAPDNWSALRVQWEYSHAANAGLVFLALCSVTLAALTARAGER